MLSKSAGRRASLDNSEALDDPQMHGLALPTGLEQSTSVSRIRCPQRRILLLVSDVGLVEGALDRIQADRPACAQSPANPPPWPPPQRTRQWRAAQ